MQKHRVARLRQTSGLRSLGPIRRQTSKAEPPSFMVSRLRPGHSAARRTGPGCLRLRPSFPCLKSRTLASCRIENSRHLLSRAPERLPARCAPVCFERELKAAGGCIRRRSDAGASRSVVLGRLGQTRTSKAPATRRPTSRHRHKEQHQGFDRQGRRLLAPSKLASRPNSWPRNRDVFLGARKVRSGSACQAMPMPCGFSSWPPRGRSLRSLHDASRS